jgi:hypothetical protein
MTSSNKIADAMQQRVENCDATHYLRVSMLFKSAWWHRLGLPGCFWVWDGFGGCRVTDESTRWKSKKGHVLSFLLSGQDALTLCNQHDREIVRCVLDRLPSFMTEASREFIEGAVARCVGCLQPCDEHHHQPEPSEHAALFMVSGADLNGALISAATAMDMLCSHFGIKAEDESKVIEELAQS